MSYVPSDTDNKAQRAKSRTYLIIAAVLLVIMSLIWSLDDSLVYITFGGAVFFIFLAVWNRPKKPEQPTASRPQENYKKDVEAPAFKDIEELLRPKRTSQSAKKGPPTDLPQASKKVVSGAAFFIFFVFILIFSAIVFLDSGSYSEEAVTYFDRAEEFRWSGEYDSAERYYQLAISIENEYPEALTGYANVLLGKNRYDEALTTLDKALKINPDYENAAYTKALAHYYQKNYQQSRSELFELLDKSPSYYDAMVLAGDDYYMQQNYDSAIYWYEEGYGNGMRSAALCHVMAYVYDEKGNTEKAIPLYREALSYDSSKVDIYTRLSELLPGAEGEWFRQTANKFKSQSN